MKTLRYLLISFAVVVAVSVGAQSLAQEPMTEFHSTSTMVGSGSALPMAVESGAYTTYDVNGGRANKAGIRTGLGGGGGTGGPEDRPEPYGDPIGDGMGVLALLTGAFAFGKWIARRTKPLR